MRKMDEQYGMKGKKVQRKLRKKFISWISTVEYWSVSIIEVFVSIKHLKLLI